MKVADLIENTIDRFACGYVFTYSDFDIEVKYHTTVVRHLNRMVASNAIVRLSKGRYYKVERSQYGNTPPDEYQVVKDLLESDGISKFELQEFELNVLDKRQTLIEKLVSLVRFSQLGVAGISSKIRHFYDIHYLLQDAECKEYIINGNFKADFESVLAHDKEMFEDPKGWQDVAIKDIPTI